MLINSQDHIVTAKRLLERKSDPFSTRGKNGSRNPLIGDQPHMLLFQVIGQPSTNHNNIINQ